MDSIYLIEARTSCDRWLVSGSATALSFISHLENQITRWQLIPPTASLIRIGDSCSK